MTVDIPKKKGWSHCETIYASIIREQFEESQVEYTTINSVVEQDEATTYPVEFLNSLSTPDLPAHIIKLKVGVPIIFSDKLEFTKIV